MIAEAGALLLDRAEVAAVLTPEACLAAVEDALRAHALGAAPASGILGFPLAEGGFHVKIAAIGIANGPARARAYFAAKINANFPGNPARFGLPTIQGIVLLCDASDGRPLALMDSGEITRLRTAAATAAAARVLARKDSRVAAICGCGAQAAPQLRALAGVLPITRAIACDADPARAARFARETTAALGIPIATAASPSSAAREADVVVTCTPARAPILRLGDVRRGTFVAAVGADAPEKRELAGDLVAAAKLVVDSAAQCAEIGELHHAIAEGVVGRDRAPVELGDVLAGKQPGRESAEEVTVFDSTGVALEDVAAAAAAYERALAAGAGRPWNPSGPSA